MQKNKTNNPAAKIVFLGTLFVMEKGTTSVYVFAQCS